MFLHCSFAHPYLLADNRHYTFYLWKNVIRAHWSAKYCLIPLYLYSWWSILNCLGEFLTLNPPLAATVKFTRSMEFWLKPLSLFINILLVLPRHLFALSLSRIQGESVTSTGVFLYYEFYHLTSLTFYFREKGEEALDPGAICRHWRSNCASSTHRVSVLHDSFISYCTTLWFGAESRVHQEFTSRLDLCGDQRSDHVPVLVSSISVDAWTRCTTIHMVTSKILEPILVYFSNDCVQRSDRFST